MLSLSAAAILEKNSLSNDGSFLTLCEIVLPDDSVIRLVDSTQDVAWNGNTYTRFPFKIDGVSDSSKDEIPSVSLSVGNVTRAIQAIIEPYHGLADAEVRIMIVHSAHLDLTTPEVTLYFRVTGTVADSQWVTFHMGASNPFQRRFPQGRLLRNFCRWKFKSTECGYSGSETTCNKSLDRCRQLSNSPRFGGFPGVGRGGVYA